MSTAISLLDRYQGCLLGLACGDAVGTTVEFMARGSFVPVTDMVGGGPFQLDPGQWTDDTSMALCLAESLIALGTFDAKDQMHRYVRWWRDGHLSSTGKCFDIGRTTAAALGRFERSGEPMAGVTDPRSAGNGSLMRLAPVILFCHPDRDQLRHLSAESSKTTHGAVEAVECCMLLADRISAVLAGESKSLLLDRSVETLTQPKVATLSRSDFLSKSRDDIIGSGYAVASLEAALWCFAHTESFEQAVLAAVNLGDDADTTAAIVGQLAGAYYGRQGIPERWLKRLHLGGTINDMATALLALSLGSSPTLR